MKKTKFCLLIFSLFLMVNKSYAVELQILHTNDLHGHFEHTVYEKNHGGYENIKMYMDYLKFIAKRKGVKTLQLDAGDFSEGSFFYFANRGLSTFKALEKMGYDAIVLGNHDWLMGEEILSEILEEVRPTYSLLGANFLSDKQYEGIKQFVRPYRIFKIEGLRVAVLGITTSELFYSWRVKNTKIKEPIKYAKKFAKYLKKNKKVDYVIALTHLGLDKDINLAKDSEYIDLIVGGHSHTPLFKEKYIENKKGFKVPIVQAGHHGKYVGKLNVELNKNNNLKVKNYKLLKVFKTPLPDLKVKKYVKSVRRDLEDIYGKEWLREVVGRTEIDLINSTQYPTFWTNFIAEAFREATNSDISFNVPALAGNNFKKGPITREDLFWLYPRVFEFDNKMGWTLWSNEMYGFVLKITLDIVVNNGFALGMSGITFDKEKKDNGKYKITNIRVNGEKLKNFNRYSVTMPEGVYRGAFGISKLLGFVFLDTFDTRINIIDSLENKIIRSGGIIGDSFREISSVRKKSIDSLSSNKEFRGNKFNKFENTAWVSDEKYR